MSKTLVRLLFINSLFMFIGCTGEVNESTQNTGSSDSGHDGGNGDADIPVSEADGGQDAGADAGDEGGEALDEPLKAFPSAYGGGANASGGRGGVLIVVNSTNPRDPLIHFPATTTTPERYEGGLYDALQLDEPAYIVFDRSMNIQLGVGGTNPVYSGYGIPHVHDKTVFGQSAPRGGITLTGGTVRFDGHAGDMKNLIFRYMRSRPIRNRDGNVSTEDDLYTWGMLFFGGEDIVVDHGSFSFAQDKALGAAIRDREGGEMKNFTFSRNFISDSHTGFYVEINPGREGNPEELVDAFSFLSNAIVGVNRTPNVAYDGYAEVLNNVVYGDNYKSTTVYHDLKLNHVGNYYERPGMGLSGFNRIFTHDDSSPRVFTEGNFYTGLLQGVSGEDNKAIFKYRDEYGNDVPAEYFVDTPFPTDIEHVYPVLSAAEAHASIVTDGDIGANAYLDDEGRPQIYHDPYDAEILELMRSGGTPDFHKAENWVLPTIPQSVRPSSYDTDFDGMADAWEMRVFGDLSQSYDGDHDNDGYTNIEEFMFQVDVP